MNVILLYPSSYISCYTILFLQLSAADFRNNEALETLLPLLEKTFSEFKTHEHIENQYIMERLKQRLKIMNVTCHAVCNCHKDNDLVEASFLHLLLCQHYSSE